MADKQYWLVVKGVMRSIVAGGLYCSVVVIMAAGF